MAVATVVAAVGNLTQVLQGAPELLPAAIGPLVAAGLNIALIRPIEQDRPWAVPIVMIGAVLWIGTAVVVETEAGVFLYACFGSVYLAMLGSIASERPGAWAIAGGGVFVGLLSLRQLVSPLASLQNSAELGFTALAGGVATWAVAAWMARILVRLQSVNVDLVAARDAALGANRAKDQFLANMSHELRTPLTAIQGYAEILVDETTLEASAQRDVEAIHASARHLHELLSAVLDLSRIDAGGRAVTLAPVDLAEVVEDAIRTSRPLAVAGNNQIEASVSPDLGQVTTDGTMLRQILLNLLGNACKFTEGGHIRVEARREDGEVSFVVADTGIGIPEDRIDAVFDRFVQADNSSTRRHDGVGLGLALVHRLCELLGGSVEVESTVGVGSTFRVRLPIRPQGAGRV